MSSVAQLVLDTAGTMGVPPQLALEVAIHESNLNPNARGAAGEIGVFQLMPQTAAELGVNPYDLGENIRGGILYLKQNLARFGDSARALAAFNCGPRCVMDAVTSFGADWLRGVPATTRSYVAKILGRLQTEWSTSVAVPIPPVLTVPAPDADRWRKFALIAGVGLLLYFGTRLLAEEG